MSTAKKNLKLSQNFKPFLSSLETYSKLQWRSTKSAIRSVIRCWRSRCSARAVVDCPGKCTPPIQGVSRLINGARVKILVYKITVDKMNWNDRVGYCSIHILTSSAPKLFSLPPFGKLLPLLFVNHLLCALDTQFLSILRMFATQPFIPLRSSLGVSLVPSCLICEIIVTHFKVFT